MDILIGAPILDMSNPEYQGKYLLLDMGAKGAAEFKAKYKNAIFVYVIPPTKERLVGQMKGRHPDRLARNKRQIAQAMQVCDWLIINDDRDESAEVLERIMSIIRKYGQNLDDIPQEDLEFLYAHNFHNKQNRKFLERFYDEVSYPDQREIE